MKSLTFISIQYSSSFICVLTQQSDGHTQITTDAQNNIQTSNDDDADIPTT
jgi:hypothetical protein